MLFENKLVALINKEIEVGVAMNAIAHMTLGLGASLGKEPIRLDDYQDKDGHTYPHISQIPFIILQGKSNEIRKAVHGARENALQYGVFLNTMTGGTYLEQLERTHVIPEEELVYYGAVLFGPWDLVSQLTKRFSLYRG
jgi:hypothetical protein